MTALHGPKGWPVGQWARDPTEEGIEPHQAMSARPSPPMVWGDPGAKLRCASCGRETPFKANFEHDESPRFSKKQAQRYYELQLPDNRRTSQELLCCSCQQSQGAKHEQKQHDDRAPSACSVCTVAIHPDELSESQRKTKAWKRKCPRCAMESKEERRRLLAAGHSLADEPGPSEA